MVSEQARKFEEAALKQQQNLSRQQRIEQRRKIEDRWMNRRKDSTSAVSSRQMPLVDNRVYRSQQYPTESLGYHSDGGSQQQPQRYTGGYQSEDQSRESHDAGYLSEGGDVRYSSYHQNSRIANSVDSDAITPQDARRRLWDENERLRVVLPRHESHRSNSYGARDQLPEPLQHARFASPGNHSGSSSVGRGGARFKSKFVHAAALAAQNGASENWHHSQKFHPMQQHTETGEELHQQRQLRDYTHTKKNSTVVSHFTDSTAETTADVTTIPGGSFGSSRNSNYAARKISLSPPRHLSKAHDGHYAMPSIDEQNTTPTLSLPEECQKSTLSVADLIARINAVSRSNPEQALAAIDSIIKRESDGVDRNNYFMRSRGAGSIKSVTKITQEVDHSRTHAITPRTNEENCLSGEVRHLGKDFFQENNEEVLQRDPDKVMCATDAPGSRETEDHSSADDDDDSLLSSDESTVSSMTDPTYQSVKLKPTAPKDAPTLIERCPHESKLQPQKSWNTLKREYTARKLSPADNEENNAPLEKGDASQSVSKDELKFSPVERDDKHRQQEQQLNHDRTITKLERKSAPKGVVNSVIRTQSASNDDMFGNLYAENSHNNSRGLGGTSLKQESMDNSYGKKKSKLPSSHQSQRNQPRSGSALMTPSKTPETNRANKSTMRPDTPDLMMAVTSAFANVDISFGGPKSISHPSENVAAVASRPTDRPMPGLISPESDDGEKTLKSFQTISDAFSDVDVCFEQEKTVSQRRKDLEYYSKSWTTSKSSSYDSGDNQQLQAKHQSTANVAAATKWAKSSLSKSRGNTTKEKKMAEPTLRLKGNKSLAQKFANLVKAFDD